MYYLTRTTTTKIDLYNITTHEESWSAIPKSAFLNTCLKMLYSIRLGEVVELARMLVILNCLSH